MNNVVPLRVARDWDAGNANLAGVSIDTEDRGTSKPAMAAIEPVLAMALLSTRSNACACTPVHNRGRSFIAGCGVV